MSAELRVGYVLAAYPVLSETFILNEILAHEAAGLALEIFSVGPSLGGEVHDLFARVRTSAQYLGSDDAVTEAQIARRGAELAGRAAAQGVTHLHAHFAGAATDVARIAAARLGITYSFTAHAVDIFHDDVNAERVSRMLAGAAFAVTVSEYNVRFLRERFGSEGELHLVRNGLDLSRFPYSTPAERRSNVVAAGRLVEKKGFANLLDACALLAAEGMAFRCTIVGAGPLSDALRAQAEAVGLAERVAFTGALGQDAVAEHMRSGAVFVAPCVVASDGNRDGLPTVLLEAMALGTPVISTEVTGIPELVQHESTGLLCPPEDPHALAEGISRMLANPELRVRLASNARALIEQQFDVHQNTAELRRLFQTAMSATRT